MISKKNLTTLKSKSDPLSRIVSIIAINKISTIPNPTHYSILPNLGFTIVFGELINRRPHWSVFMHKHCQNDPQIMLFSLRTAHINTKPVRIELIWWYYSARGEIYKQITDLISLKQCQIWYKTCFNKIQAANSCI